MKNPYEYHYLPIFNVGNRNQDPMQMSFSFERDEEQLAKVIQDYESEYEEWITKFDIHPKRVIACGFTSDKFICRIYNSNQELVSQQNYSHLIDAKFDHLSNDNRDVTPPTKTQQSRNMRPLPKGRRILGLRKRD
ncbi:hypothetical protein [Staphylococcus simulans]|uniref:hypothetical protein n=1 Tax=Staphylococcus simulans TaxID=1286 RepID=UPI0021D42013|nr:hypothetical protein [Staphylococcus simulans]UXR32950.1 hypothetical protein MUA81_00850 [Staphylococcus simulans]